MRALFNSVVPKLPTKAQLELVIAYSAALILVFVLGSMNGASGLRTDREEDMTRQWNSGVAVGRSEGKAEAQRNLLDATNKCMKASANTALHTLDVCMARVAATCGPR